MTSPYRAYDIRGIYPDEVNTSLVGEVIPVLLKDFMPDGEIVVGHDPRIGSKELYQSALEEIKKGGRVPIEVGLITTPMLTFLVDDLNAGGGIMITASHNPKEYNGIKMVNKLGEQISGEDVYKKLEK